MPDAERATKLIPNVPSPPRSTSNGETLSESSPRRMEVRPPSWVIQSSTVAGPLGPASSTAYWSLNLGFCARIERFPPFAAPPWREVLAGGAEAKSLPIPALPDRLSGSVIGKGSANAGPCDGVLPRPRGASDATDPPRSQSGAAGEALEADRLSSLDRRAASERRGLVPSSSCTAGNPGPAEI